MRWLYLIIYTSDLNDVSIIDFHHLKVVHVVDGEAHNRAIGLGLLEQFTSFGMHGDGEAVVLAHLTQAGDMVDMGMGEQDMCHLQMLLLNVLCQLCILERRLGGRVDDGTFLRAFVDDEVTVDLEMVEYKLLNHLFVLFVSVFTTSQCPPLSGPMRSNSPLAFRLARCFSTARVLMPICSAIISVVA